MSAEIIQFVPRPNPKRDMELACEAIFGLMWEPYFAVAHAMTGTIRPDYVAPDKDQA